MRHERWDWLAGERRDGDLISRLHATAAHRVRQRAAVVTTSRTAR